MGMTYRQYLSGPRIYGCSNCRTHLATIESMMSRAFNGQHGRAYLFMKVVNVIEGEACERAMTTGQHTVRDIYCVKCGTTLGWKYASVVPTSLPVQCLGHLLTSPFRDQEVAQEPSQKYKEGHYILERNLLVDVQ